MTNRCDHRWCSRRYSAESRRAHTGRYPKLNLPLLTKHYGVSLVWRRPTRRVLNKRPIFVPRCRRLQFKLKRKCIIPRQCGAALCSCPGVKSTKIAKRRTYIYASVTRGAAGCTRRDDTRVLSLHR